MNAVEVSPVPGFHDSAPSVRERPSDFFDQSFGFTFTDVFDQVFQATVVSPCPVAFVAENRCDCGSHINSAFRRNEQAEWPGELRFTGKSAADAGVPENA